MSLNKKPRKKRNGKPAQAKLPVEHLSLFAYAARYLEWLKVKGFSAETAHRRDSALRQFIVWCDERSLNHPNQITKPMLERYQRHLFYYRQANGKPLAHSTQNQYLAGIKAWFKWLTQENYLPSNPASEVMPIRLPKRLPEAVLSVEDVEQVLSSINVSDVEGLRNRAMLEVFYSTGIRRGELANVLVGDIDPQRGSLFVRQGKGSKDRCIPVGQRALDWVMRYREHARPQLLVSVLEQHLFLNAYGEAFSTSQLGHLVRRLLDDAGIERTGSCHLFRHAMATHMLENGADLQDLQAILGHAELNTTTIYTHLSIERLRRVHESTHPAEK